MAKKKKHWTQTAKGRAHMRAIMLGRKHPKGKDRTDNDPQKEDADIAFALGFVSGWLEAYASRAGIPAPALANRVGKLLQVAARR